MKNTSLISWLGAGALVFGLASCANDDMPSPVASSDCLTFEVSVPENMQTRAFADGLSATNLKVAVYNAADEGAEPILSNFEGGSNASQITITPVGDLKYQVSIPLASGVNYNVVFWAQSYADGDTSNPYTYTPATKSISVDYSKMAMNTEKTDAFFAYAENISGSTAQTRTVTLYRPFAQINVGTGDMAEYTNAGGAGITTTALTFSNLATEFNLATKKATGSATDVAYPAAAIPTDETFPAGENMTYLAMAYVLVGDATSDKAQINTVSLSLNGATDVYANYDNIPAQRNYRTNIFGNLLTNKTQFNVTIKPNFNTPDYDVSVWNGMTYTTPSTDKTGAYVVNTAAELAGVMKMAQTDNMEGKVVKLNSDVDMAGSSSWTSIGSSTKPFAGEFDGQGHTVKGIANSMFSYVEAANIHDVTVDVDNVKYSALVQKSQGNTTITNVTTTGTVNGSAPLSKLGASGLVSRVTSGCLTIDNCTNRADIVDNGYVAGGLVGSTDTYTTNNTLVVIKNSDNYGLITSTRPSQGKGAGIICMPAAYVEVTNCNNYGDVNVTTTAGGAAGGVMAWSSRPATISKCTNSGNVALNLTKQNSIAGAGGMFGATGWLNDTLAISGCANTGKITTNCGSGVGTSLGQYTTGVYAGGMIGVIDYGTVAMTDCSNSGAITCKSPATGEQLQYVSGLAGGLGWLDALTITGCTVDAATTLTGNLKPLLGAYYNLNGDAPKTSTISGNTNSTSYSDSAK